jgi:hypothetical protein
MSSRSTIIVAAGIAILAFGATGAFAHGGGHGGGGGGGGHMGGGGGHMGGFVGHGFGGFYHRGHFFVGGAFVPYDDDYYEYDYEDCPLVHARVQTRHGLRWRWVRYCGD